MTNDVTTRRKRRAGAGAGQRQPSARHHRQERVRSLRRRDRHAEHLGTLLKFVKGDWLIGRDGEKCPEKELVAIMPGLVHGWIRWEDNFPVEHNMGLLIEGFILPNRAELGHQEQETWRLEANGERRDPWQQGIYLPMVAVDGKTVYTFTATSDGGRRRGVAPLCRNTATTSASIRVSYRWSDWSRTAISTLTAISGA